MRKLLLVIGFTSLFAAMPAPAQVSFGFGAPGVSVGFNIGAFPQLVAIPGYPVYYAPQVNANYFFYDGMFWVYVDDNWYTSAWYDGPWELVAPVAVPVFILRVPVRYYRHPPYYFRTWAVNGPPHWGEHWGHSWAERRRGWDRWDRTAAPRPAPLPTYQRQYSGNRYPNVERQHALQNQHYRYRPRDAVVRQHYQRVQTGDVSARGQQRQIQQAQQRQVQQAQRSQQREVQQAQRAQQQAQQREARQAQREQQAQQRERERVSQGRGDDRRGG